jgi:hypothetical protein
MKECEGREVVGMIRGSEVAELLWRLKGKLVRSWRRERRKFDEPGRRGETSSIAAPV